MLRLALIIWTLFIGVHLLGQTTPDSLLNLANQYREEGDLRECATTHYKLGKWYYNNYQDSLAIEQYSIASGIAQEIGYFKLNAIATNRTGNIISEQGKYEEAITYYQKAISIADEAKNDTIKASFCNNLGLELKSLGKYQEAVEVLYDALELKEKIGASKKSISSTLLNIGLVWDILESQEEAINYYHRSLEIKRELGDSLGISRLLTNISAIYKNQEEYALALEMIEESNRFNKTALDLEQFYNNYTNLGNIWKRKGNEEKALLYFDSAYFYGDKINNPELLSDVTQNLGVLYYDKGDFSKAAFHLNRAYVLAGDEMTAVVKHELHQQLANAYGKLGQSDSAFKHLQLSNFYRDSLFNLESQKNIQEVREQYETAKKDKELAEQKVVIQSGRIRSLIITIIAIGILFLALGIYLYQKNRREKERALAQERITTEKNRISKELHDNIGSRLTYMISSLENTQMSKQVNTEEALQRLSDFGRDTIADLRTTVWAMKQDHGNISVLQQRINELKNTVNDVIEIQLQEASESSFSLSATELLALFRIVQEFTQNAIKHGAEKRISVHLRSSSNQLELILTDHGSRFNTSELALGSGLTNMKKRAEAINASYSLDSQHQEGVRLVMALIRH